MTHTDYETRALALAIYPQRGDNLTYTVLGLAGEAGEVADKLKKVLRDQDGEIGPSRLDMLRELGDVLWYVTACAAELDSSLEEVAKMNLEKLESRVARGVLHGEGDER